MTQSRLDIASLECPDDRGALVQTGERLRCQSCDREFARTADGVWDLLPLESMDQASPEGQRLQSYRAGFSRCPDRAYLRPGRVLIAELGNAYLYSWAGCAIKAIAGGESLSILDAACGDGMLSRYIPKRHLYVGSDFSARPLARASRYYPAQYFRADLNRLPFASPSFDVVVTLQALQYLERPERAVEEIQRVLRPGGHFILSVPNDDGFKYRRQGVPAIQLSRFRRDTMLNLMSRGFRCLELEARGFWLPIPRIGVHIPGRYSDRTGLSWTAVCGRES